MFTILFFAFGSSVATTLTKSTSPSGVCWRLRTRETVQPRDSIVFLRYCTQTRSCKRQIDFVSCKKKPLLYLTCLTCWLPLEPGFLTTAMASRAVFKESSSSIEAPEQTEREKWERDSEDRGVVGVVVMPWVFQKCLGKRKTTQKNSALRRKVCVALSSFFSFAH